VLRFVNSSYFGFSREISSVKYAITLVGGVLFMALAGFNWSVATAMGFIALAGVAAATGVVMLIYIDHAWDRKVQAGTTTMADLYEAIMEGAVERVRPKIMTATAITVGLLPLLFGHGAGGSVMRRIAAPMIGGMVSSTILTLIVIPAIYSLWKGYDVRRDRRRTSEAGEIVPVPVPAGGD
jgi:copper/silver efflux system protein